MNFLITSFKALLLLVFLILNTGLSFASSHREAPLIANDPYADNTDVYAFRDPNNPEMINIIANFSPFSLPQGGPIYYPFGFDVQYSIHIDNDINTPGDDIIYNFRFIPSPETFETFFAVREGLQSIKYILTSERSTDGGANFSFLATSEVPPWNIGERSIESSFGMNSTYDQLVANAIANAPSGENIYAGPADDPFFVDLGGIFDIGDAPRQNGMPVDGIACTNTNTIALQIPISTLQKDGKTGAQAANILDPEFVIGVWASASRRATRTLTQNGPMDDGNWVQVSRLGMPLTNEVIIPIGEKDQWNGTNPYDVPANFLFSTYFFNPELALYMDDSQFGSVVPALSDLRVQSGAGGFDFRNLQPGLFPLKGTPTLAGTALDDAVFGNLLLPFADAPRAVDLFPLFNYGVPNMAPYQLATGKNGNPFAAGKPFVHNFLPNGGDMLRLNMAVPATPRDDPDFSSLGLIQAAVLGLTNAQYASNSDLQFIPNMDGFPNGRRLEDDVTRIELQAVSGAVLAAIGFGYDDYTTGASNVVTPKFMDVINYSTGIESNDLPFRDAFPYMALPHSGSGNCSGKLVTSVHNPGSSALGLTPKEIMLSAYPNPLEDQTTFTLHIRHSGLVTINVYDLNGRLWSSVFQENLPEGDHNISWSAKPLPAGVYLAKAYSNSGSSNIIKLIKIALD